MYTPEEVEKAKKKVKAKKDFYQHMMIFACCNVFLLALNLLTSPTKLWFHFTFLGWGVFLLFHYVEAFGVPGFDILNKEWEERELKEELNKNKKRNSEKINETDEKLELKEIERRYDENDLV